MMKKGILFLVLVCMVMGLSENAQALTTSQTLNGSTNPQWFIPNGTDPYPGDFDFGRYLPSDGINPYYRAYNEDWGWTHTVTFNVPGPVTILGATLAVEAWDVDLNSGGDIPELDAIKVGTTNGSGGVNLGNLSGSNNAWYTTTFTLNSAALAKLAVVGNTTGTLNVWMDISTLESNTFLPYYWFVTLRKATLTVDYIPAPAAIILGSLGAGLVGWLRRRRTL